MEIRLNKPQSSIVTVIMIKDLPKEKLEGVFNFLDRNDNDKLGAFLLSAGEGIYCCVACDGPQSSLESC